MDSLGLKELTLKTLALVALSCSDRGQTIHLLRTDRMTFEENQIQFVVTAKIKTTRRVLKPLIVSCIATNDPALNVKDHVQEYVSRTQGFRNQGVENSSQLFLSWKTHKPVCKASISRWLTQVLGLAGIDTSKYKAHSYRGASVSEAKAKGASIKSIMMAGRWKNISTFQNYYEAPNEDSGVGQLILNGVGNYY